MPLTTKRIAQILSISDSEAYSLARGLLVIGVLEEAGSIKEEGKRGRGQTVYKVTFDGYKLGGDVITTLATAGGVMPEPDPEDPIE